jgi:hypothetical protein
VTGGRGSALADGALAVGGAADGASSTHLQSRARPRGRYTGEPWILRISTRSAP